MDKRIKPPSPAMIVAIGALIVAVAGTAVATPIAVKSLNKKEKKVVKKIAGKKANQAIDQRAPGLSVKHAGSADTANSAASADTAKGVAPDSVGAAGIQNPTRSVNLPIQSFVNGTDGAPFDFAASDGTSPDFLVDGPGAVVLEWDDDTDGGGANTGDTDYAMISLTVPQDYASGGTFAFRASKASSTASVDELLWCSVMLNGGPVGSTGVSLFLAQGSTSYTCTPDPPNGPAFAPGASVNLRVKAGDNTFPGGGTFDDPVRLHSAEFRYTAAQ
jgi:hypothetical protein